MAERVASAIPHRLGRCEARRRIAEGFSSDQPHKRRAGLAGTFLMREPWDGYRLNFRLRLLSYRICGRFEVLAESVQIEIDAPDLLLAVAGELINALNARIWKLLEAGVVYPLHASGAPDSSLPPAPYPALDAGQTGMCSQSPERRASAERWRSYVVCS